MDRVGGCPEKPRAKHTDSNNNGQSNDAKKKQFA
jgi:hypothetical protein